MEMELPPKKIRKKKLKKEEGEYDSSVDYNSRDILESAVNNIIDTSPNENGPVPAKNYKCKKFVEPDLDRVVFQKISVPQTMRSIYWKYFGFPANSFGEILTKRKVICTLCLAQYVYLQNTSNLRSHLSHRHKAQFIDLVQNESDGNVTLEKMAKKKPKVAKTISSPNKFRVVDVQSEHHTVADSYSICVQGENEGEHAIINFPSPLINGIKSESRNNTSMQETKSLIDIIVDYVILDLNPPYVVNNAGFRHLVASMTSQCEVPTEASIVQDHIPKMYECLKNTMYNDITALNMTDNVFSMAIEHWKASDEREYVSYYINYLQNEEIFTTKLLHTFLLDRDQLFSEYYHQEMFNVICSSWNIKVNNIKAIVLSTDNDTFTRVLSATGVPVIPCFIKTLSEMCLKAFQLEPNATIISKCRALVSKIYNKNNYAIQVAFEDQPSDNGEGDASFLSLDNPKIWTSTLNMLEALNVTRSKLDIILEISENMENPEYDNMTNEDWNNLSILIEILNPMRVAEITLGEEKPAQASLILPLYLQLVSHHLKVKSEDCEITSDLKSYFVETLQRKYSNIDSFLQVCTALDPRVKKLPYIEENDVLSEVVKDMLLTMEPSSETTKYYNDVIEQDSKKNCRLSGMEFLLGNVTATSASFKPRSKEASHEDNMIYEIEQYKKSASADLRTCPLKWWKSHCNKFPNIYSLASKYTCIPANALPHYKISCKEQNLYVEKRNLLSVNAQHVLNHLLFLHHNYSV